MTSKSYYIPPGLLLGPHLSASRYLMVCALSIAAWDTLVLSERTWNITKTREQLPLKIILLVLRYLIPVEYIVLGIIHFDPSIQPSTCNHLTLLEPILTTSLLLLSSFALILIFTSTPSTPLSASEIQRAASINTQSAQNSVTTTLTSTSLLSHFNSPTQRAVWFLLLVQLILHAIGTAFFQSINVGSGKGCISGPGKSHGAWAGIYYLGATFVYLVNFGWTLRRSVKGCAGSMSVWKAFVMEPLGLHGTIAIVNLINLIVVFATEPRDDTDPIRSVVSPLSTVLTATSTMRIILSRIGRDGTLNRHRSSISESGSGIGRVSILGNNINTNTNNQTITKDATGTIPISIATPLPTPAAKARVRTPPLSRYLHDRPQYGHPSDGLSLPTPSHTTHFVLLNKQ